MGAGGGHAVVGETLQVTVDAGGRAAVLELGPDVVLDPLVHSFGSYIGLNQPIRVCHAGQRRAVERSVQRLSVGKENEDHPPPPWPCELPPTTGRSALRTSTYGTTTPSQLRNNHRCASRPSTYDGPNGIFPPPPGRSSTYVG